MDYADQSKENATRFGATVSLEEYAFGALIVKTKLAQAVEQGISKFPIYRYLGFAARTDIHDLFDSLAFNLDMQASRLAYRSLYLSSEHAFVSARGITSSDYCSFSFEIWADSVAIAQQTRQKILDEAGDARITSPMFTLDWHFVSEKGLESSAIEELAEEKLLDEAYPDIEEGVAKFVDSYLASSESILVLQGPPGTGKTRLIRFILGKLSRRNRSRANILFTSDQQVLQRDEIFVRFLTGRHDAFVFEDADEILKPRSGGNDHLHRFLTIADGVVRAQARKIIFSTNLPNVHDLDDALVRPGRCFKRMSVRELAGEEARRLARRLSADARVSFDQIEKQLEMSNGCTYSIAEIYKLVKAGKPREVTQHDTA